MGKYEVGDRVKWNNSTWNTLTAGKIYTIEKVIGRVIGVKNNYDDITEMLKKTANEHSTLIKTSKKSVFKVGDDVMYKGNQYRLTINASKIYPISIKAGKVFKSFTEEGVEFVSNENIVVLTHAPKDEGKLLFMVGDWVLFRNKKHKLESNNADIIRPLRITTFTGTYTFTKCGKLYAEVVLTPTIPPIEEKIILEEGDIVEFGGVEGIVTRNNTTGSYPISFKTNTSMYFFTADGRLDTKHTKPLLNLVRRAEKDIITVDGIKYQRMEDR